MTDPIGQVKEATRNTVERMKAPSMALLGATALVSLFAFESKDEVDGPSPPAILARTILAETLKVGWLALACLLGVVGSFFSGSTTLSNLTFDQVPKSAAETLGLSATGILSLQAVGGSMGNMICIQNILSAKAVVGLSNVPEGVFIKKMVWVLLIYAIVATLASLLFLFNI
jgi:lactate permease